MKIISMFFVAMALIFGAGFGFADDTHGDVFLALDDRGVRVNYGDHYKRRRFQHPHGNYRHKRYRHQHHRFDQRRNNHRYKHRSNRYADVYRNRFNRYRNQTAWSRKPCHQVYRKVYDDYGRPRKFGGTMCYNDYGEGYIVRGSRYRIR